MGVTERGTCRGVAVVCREAGRSREASSRRHCSLNGLCTSDGVAGRVFSMCWRCSHQCENGLTVFISRTSVCVWGAAAAREARDVGRWVSRDADRCEGLVTDAEYGGRSALITDDSDDGCHDDSPSCDDAYVCEGRPRIESSSVVRVINGAGKKTALGICVCPRERCFYENDTRAAASVGRAPMLGAHATQGTRGTRD